MNDSASNLVMISTIVSIVALIVFFVMAYNVDKIKDYMFETELNTRKTMMLLKEIKELQTPVSLSEGEIKEANSGDLNNPELMNTILNKLENKY